MVLQQARLLEKEPTFGYRIRDAVRILGIGIRGIGKVGRGIQAGFTWIWRMVQSLWGGIRRIGKFGMTLLNWGRAAGRVIKTVWTGLRKASPVLKAAIAFLETGGFEKNVSR